MVTQRDEWEDHYRLMEALSCGAMVVSDVMLAPPFGLMDRENVVYFRNLTHLKDVVTYYLNHDQERIEIARKGWELAMGRHRSWHRLEELLFGCPQTSVHNTTNR